MPQKVPLKSTQMKYDAQQELSSQLSKAKPLLSLVRYHIKSFRWNKRDCNAVICYFLKKKARRKQFAKKHSLSTLKCRNSGVGISLLAVWPEQVNINLSHVNSTLTLWSRNNSCNCAYVYQAQIRSSLVLNQQELILGNGNFYCGLFNFSLHMHTSGSHCRRK